MFITNEKLVEGLFPPRLKSAAPAQDDRTYTYFLVALLGILTLIEKECVMHYIFAEYVFLSQAFILRF